MADLADKSRLWLYSQRFVREVLQAGAPRWYLQKSVTLYVPEVNRLPETLNQLVQAVTEGSREEFIQQFGRPPLRLALQVEGKLGDPQAIKDAIKENNLESASITFDLVDAYFAAGNREEARRRPFEAHQRMELQKPKQVRMISAGHI